MKFPDEPSPLVLVTGSHGLIGTALTVALTHAGYAVRGIDLRADGAQRGDICNREHMDRALAGCVGVVHLAAVSRVIDGERDPEGCWRTNVEGTRNVLEAAQMCDRRPWVLYASSREVYGQPPTLPASEDSPRVPVNIYGRSKVAAEDLARQADLLTAVIRFSNVYGWTRDHADRVVPAFARQAAMGQPLRVDGRSHTFDFTHLEDTAHGLLAVVARLEAGIQLPPIHFLTGTPTTLGQLASLAVELAGSDSPIHEAPPRSYDVAGFYGDPTRAAEVLEWRAKVGLREGLTRLIQDFRVASGTVEVS
ncbi:MAG TPA: NAD(P)-dependent oxidoreductase [Myxococcota bacterium]|nr:NAD(P)-dependent oxidoreductase [Myxococcota bacterium]